MAVTWLLHGCYMMIVTGAPRRRYPEAVTAVTVGTAVTPQVRRGDDIKILDDNLTMQRVWDIAQAAVSLRGGRYVAVTWKGRYIT